MNVYTHPKYSYVRVAEILKSEIKKLDFATCKQPKETLAAFYQRQTEKPALVVNGGFFNMSTGEAVFNYQDEQVVMSRHDLHQWGMGVTTNNELIFGHLTSRNWRDFMSGYPNLVENGQKVSTAYLNNSSTNCRARRTMLGYNDTRIFIVCVESPGMIFSEMQNLMLSIGCKYAINLDGGGSTNMLAYGKTITTDSYNRPIDNVVAVYLNSNTTTNTTNYSSNTTQSSIYLKPDLTMMTTMGGKTLTIKQKIIPDGTVATKRIASYIAKGDLVKPQCKVNNGTGKPRGIVVHNTPAIKVNAATTMAEQYSRATYNGNMGGSMVHYYVSGYDDIWQLLNTDVGYTEQGWHAGDKSTRRDAHAGAKYSTIGGNLDCIAIEIIGDSEQAKQAGAALVAYLCQKHKLDPMVDVYTHNYFMKQPDRIVNGAYKNCPVYILPNWQGFLSLVKQNYGGQSGGTSAPTFQVGNIVQFTGNMHYSYANALTGSPCRPGKAKILNIYMLGKSRHPYAVRYVAGGGSTVYGWVDEKDIQSV